MTLPCNGIYSTQYTRAHRGARAIVLLIQFSPYIIFIGWELNEQHYLKNATCPIKDTSMNFPLKPAGPLCVQRIAIIIGCFFFPYLQLYGTLCD